MRLLFGNPVFSGLASGRSVGALNGVGTHLPARSVSRILCRRDDREPLLSFPGSAVQTGDGLLHVVHSPSSDSDPLPETVWAEGTRVFLGPRPLQLAGVALTSTGELRAVFARGHLCGPVQLRVDQATLSAADIHTSLTTWEALAPTMRDEDALHVVAACVNVAAFTYRQAELGRNDLCAVQ